MANQSNSSNNLSLNRCDERFVGYGSNKAACLYEIFLAGAQFWVLPQDFLIHQRHPYPENDRRVEVCFTFIVKHDDITESDLIIRENTTSDSMMHTERKCASDTQE